MKVPFSPAAPSGSTSNALSVFNTIPPLHTMLSHLPGPIALVPTMGALHAGHISLLRRAAIENPTVIISIFVNPTQFAPTEDLSTYPRTLDADLKLLNQLNFDLAQERKQGENIAGSIKAVFAPTDHVMYPNPPTASSPGSYVTVLPISTVLEGQSRPTFFRGVTTVCMKLFHIIRPDVVYFGQKDIQQTVVIKRMVQDFCMDNYLRVRIGPTVREEPDGLALSSRNVYLGTRRRKVATVLVNALRVAEGVFAKGSRLREDILGAANEVIAQEQKIQSELPSHLRVLFKVDYISLADSLTLAELDDVEDGKGAIISGAIKMLPVEDVQGGEDPGFGGGMGTVRLIDNILLGAAAKI
ncbi:MAG: pantothenate synthase [Cirrosporium novae-zelandiae]|nr:MAG: pantothenate synthase [Cirrosporium novae-zelandiae]